MCPSLDDSADDISGNGYNGSYQGGMGTVADTTYGGTRAYDFDGVDDYVACGNISTAMSNQSATTLSVWFIQTSIPVHAGIVGRRGSSGSLWAFKSTGNRQRHDYHYTDSPNGRIQLSSSAISAGTWYHFCYVFDGSQTGNTGRLKVYINGVQNTSVIYRATTGTTTGTIGSGNWALGSWRDGRYLDGRIDDVRLFTRAVTQAEITHLATSRGIEGSPSSGVYDPFTNKIFNPGNGRVR
tara:strand:- start:419 stop:1135 length:717 start_codon:yes stop_codon:yes gene_type:complete